MLYDNDKKLQPYKVVTLQKLNFIMSIQEKKTTGGHNCNFLPNGNLCY